MFTKAPLALLGPLRFFWAHASWAGQALGCGNSQPSEEVGGVLIG